MMNPAPPMPKPKTSMGYAGSIIVIAALTMVIGFGWAAYSSAINGAVVSSGVVVARGKPKTIQHLDGGIVESIKVEDGDIVRANQILMTLDRSELAANLEIYQNRYASAASLRDRLRAEQVTAPEIEFSKPLTGIISSEWQAATQQQEQIFRSRRELREGQREQLREKIIQFENQIVGTKAVMMAKKRQLGFISQELESIKTLTRKKLARDSQLLSIQRTSADLQGQMGEHESELARIRNSIQDTKIQILQIDRQLREEVTTELRTTTAQLGELVQQIAATRQQLSRVEIRAPVDGIVHELQVVTIGGVVPSGGAVAQIIPTGAGYVLETKIAPSAIDSIHIGQQARVLLSAFNQRTTPELLARVRTVSADVIQEQTTGETFYKAHLELLPGEVDKLAGLQVVPGMPVEAFLTTEERSIASYLIKPLTDHFRRALRED